jgi:hypothetical protein
VIADGGVGNTGSHCVSFAYDGEAGTYGYVRQYVNVVPGTTYTWTFWHKSATDTTGRYHVYDVTNSADIVALATIPAHSPWAQMTVSVPVPLTCSVLYLRVGASAAIGTNYFDDHVFSTVTLSIGTFKNLLRKRTGSRAPRSSIITLGDS